jgi:hypothetical protein
MQFFQALAPDQWERTLYTEGALWTVRQVLAHFVITEAGIRALMANILAGGPGLPQDFDLNRYNESQVSKLDGISTQELLARFRQERQSTVDWVFGLAPDDLARTGRHPWLGVAPLEEMIQLMYRHNQIHQRDIRKLLAGG